MTLRSTIAVLLVLLPMGSACARMLPAAKRDDHPSRSAKPRVEMTATRRREGSDVTIPSTTDPNWLIGLLLPCDPVDSASTGSPAAPACRRVDIKGDSLRAPIDTAVKRRP